MISPARQRILWVVWATLLVGMLIGVVVINRSIVDDDAAADDGVSACS